MTITSTHNPFPTELHARYVSLIDSMNISQGVVALWFFHQVTKSRRDYISRKVSGKVTVTPSDVSLLEAMAQLQQDGYDITRPTFSEGRLVHLPRQS